MENEIKDISLNKYLGYRFFKLNGDNYKMIRIISISERDNTRCTILDEETGKKEKFGYDDLKDYTPLEPFGVVTFNLVLMEKTDSNKDLTKDVMVCAYRLIDLKIGIDKEPYIICRQCVHDFFSDLASQNPLNNELSGISVTKDTCPTNISMTELIACRGIEDTIMIHVYKDDNIQSMLQCVNKTLLYNMDRELTNMYEDHCKSFHISPIQRSNNRYIDGWCKDVETLLTINDFMADFNAMCEIVGIDVPLADHLVKTDTEDIFELDDVAKIFFSILYKANISRTMVIKFDYSVNMADFRNNNYGMIRDSENNIYVIVYMKDGEYLEEELVKKANEMPLSVKIGLAFVNKYL